MDARVQTVCSVFCGSDIDLPWTFLNSNGAQCPGLGGRADGLEKTWPATLAGGVLAPLGGLAMLWKLFVS